MKIFQKICLVIVVLLGLAAGLAKVFQVQGDVEYFSNAGFSLSFIILLGVAHLLGVALIPFFKTRIIGAAVLAAAFLVSTVGIFLNGDVLFGIFSLLPALLALFVAKDLKA